MATMPPPSQAKARYALHDLAEILDTPEGLTLRRIYVENDPQALVAVFEGEKLESHPNNRLLDTEAPITTWTGVMVDGGEADGYKKITYYLAGKDL